MNLQKSMLIWMSGLYIPKISELNRLRREALEKIQFLVIRKFTRVPVNIKLKTFEDKKHSSPKISLLLSEIHPEYDYTKLEYVDRLYIPLRCFRSVKNRKAIDKIKSKFNIYVYLPTVITSNYSNIVNLLIDSIAPNYNIKGFVFSNAGDLLYLKGENYKKYEFIANYTMNVFNDYTINELSNHNIAAITLSPELNKSDIQNMHSSIDKELIVYGKIKVMTAKYCLLGSSNGCYPTCDGKCKSGKNFYLKDRLGFLFKVVPSMLQPITNIYNSKTLSIEYSDLNIDYARIDVLEESIPEINNIINLVKEGKRMEGPAYTNGHLNRDV